MLRTHRPHSRARHQPTDHLPSWEVPASLVPDPGRAKCSHSPGGPPPPAAHGHLDTLTGGYQLPRSRCHSHGPPAATCSLKAEARKCTRRAQKTPPHPRSGRRPAPCPPATVAPRGPGTCMGPRLRSREAGCAEAKSSRPRDQRCGRGFTVAQTGKDAASIHRWGDSVGHAPHGTALSPTRGQKCPSEQQRGRKTEARHEVRRETPPDEIRWREHSGDRRQSTGGHEGRAQRGAWGGPSHRRCPPESLSHTHARRNCVTCRRSLGKTAERRAHLRPALASTLSGAGGTL